MSSPKLRKTTTVDDDDGKMDMSPMIDMVFLLLIFFIVNATAITVRTDPKVKPPIITDPLAVMIREGRIVINVRSDGSYTAEDLRLLQDEPAIRAYVEERSEQIERQAVTPLLHLRGDKESLFKHGRLVVRAAAAAGVEQVIFAASNR